MKRTDLDVRQDPGMPTTSTRAELVVRQDRDDPGNVTTLERTDLDDRRETDDPVAMTAPTRTDLIERHRPEGPHHRQLPMAAMDRHGKDDLDTD
jgi:hypothetical protein